MQVRGQGFANAQRPPIGLSCGFYGLKGLYAASGGGLRTERRAMQHEVIINLPGGDELRVDASHADPMSAETARHWLDEQFNAFECEPLRPTGKLLLADKVLVIARAAQRHLQEDVAWRDTYARAVSAALGRPLVRIDIPGMSVGF